MMFSALSNLLYNKIPLGLYGDCAILFQVVRIDMTRKREVFLGMLENGPGVDNMDSTLDFEVEEDGIKKVESTCDFDS